MSSTSTSYYKGTGRKPLARRAATSLLTQAITGVEAKDLDLSVLTFGKSFEKDHTTYADVCLDGRPVLIKVRGAAVTVAPTTDAYNNLKFDVKIPDGEQGAMLMSLNNVLNNPDAYPNFVLPHAEAMADYAYEQWLIVKSAIYGTNARFMSLKLKGAPYVSRVTETKQVELIDVMEIQKGEEIDLVLGVLLYMKADESEQNISYQAGWSFKVKQIKAYPRKLKTEGTEIIDIL